MARTISSVDFMSSPRVRGLRCSVAFGVFPAMAHNHLRTRTSHFGAANPSAIAHSVRGKRRATELACSGSKAKSFDHCIVDSRTHGGNLVICPRGIDAVGEEDDEKLAIRIDPN